MGWYFASLDFVFIDPPMEKKKRKNSRHKNMVRLRGNTMLLTVEMKTEKVMCEQIQYLSLLLISGLASGSEYLG